MTRLVVEWFKAPVVKDQQLNAGERALQPCVSTIASGECEIGEQARDTLVKNRAVIPAGLVAERAGQPTFADARWAADGQIVMRVDPVAGDELDEQGPVEAAFGSIVDILGGRLVT